ncbi:hypothetical protein BDZ89DRAFT_892763, partial [Hymenopellis radicata]
LRKFVWVHLLDVNRVLHRLKRAGLTISARKLRMAVPDGVVLAQLCSYEGRLPEDRAVVKVKTWRPCRNVSQV